MGFWIAIAAVGLVLSAAGLLVAVRQYRQNLLTAWEAGLLLGSYLLLLGAVVIGELLGEPGVA